MNSVAPYLGLHGLLRPVCPNTYNKYGKCPNMLYTKVLDIMANANSAGPD